MFFRDCLDQFEWIINAGRQSLGSGEESFPTNHGLNRFTKNQNQNQNHCKNHWKSNHGLNRSELIPSFLWFLQWCLWRQEEISWSWFWHILADFFPNTFTGKAIVNLCILEDIFRFAFPSIFGANRILLQYTVFESDPLVLLIELKYMWPWMMKGTCGVNKIVWAKINRAHRNKFCNFCIEHYSTIYL